MNVIRAGRAHKVENAKNAKHNSLVLKITGTITEEASGAPVDDKKPSVSPK